MRAYCNNADAVRCDVSSGDFKGYTYTCTRRNNTVPYTLLLLNFIVINIVNPLGIVFSLSAIKFRFVCRARAFESVVKFARSPRSARLIERIYIYIQYTRYAAATVHFMYAVYNRA